MKNCTMIPIFPLKCVACGVTHDGDLDKAVKDGWHISVYHLRSGNVQFAGCPQHFQDWDNASVKFLRSHKVLAQLTEVKK